MGENGSGDDVLSNDQEWIKMTPMLQRAGSSITSGVSYTWQRLVNGTWTNIVSTSGLYEIDITDHSLTVHNAGVDGVESFRCVAVCNGKTYYKVRELTDVHDPYYIVDYCTHTDSVAPGETAVFRPKVIDRATNNQDTSNNWTFAYTLIRLPSGDTVKTGTGSTFSVTYDEIDNAGGNTMTRIEATSN